MTQHNNANIAGFAVAGSGIAALVSDILRGRDDRSQAMRVALFAFLVRVASAGLAYLSQVFMARWIGSSEYGVFVTVWVMILLVGAIGIAAWKYKLFAFVAAAMYAGLAGALYAHYQSFINPDVFGLAQSLDAILAVIIGGSGTILGPVVGAFVVVFLPEYLRFADSFRLILYGLVLVLATIFMPRGIVGVTDDLWTRLTRRTA